MINITSSGENTDNTLDLFVNLPSNAWSVWPSSSFNDIKEYFRTSNGEVNLERLKVFLEETPVGTTGASTIEAIQEFLGL
jgi:hypothetical protein